ncbi:MAG TPA: hypothetical protein VGM76_08345 [Lacipirellulaceae bacterium]|jgi:hypothetical protein
MLANRINGFFAVENPLEASPASSQFPSFVSMSGRSPVMTGTTDLYQAARAQALRDYELNRLFNPEHYGIETDDYQI